MSAHHPYVCHCDPGHAWLEVSLNDMIDVGLHPWDFTRWSYYHSSKRTFFLEEDVDMGTFITSYIAKYGEQPKLIEQNYNYDCYVR